MKRIILGMTGASGTVYGLRLLDVLLQTNCEVHLAVSDAWKSVAKEESGVQILERFTLNPNVKLYVSDNFAVPIASGSVPNDGMVIAPCSGGTLGCIAAGVNQHLIHRAAEVQLKERRRLILLVRESPLSLIHLQNMERITLAGGIIQPACPCFYSGGNTNDLIDSVVARTLDLLGVEHNVSCRYSCQ
ncbi:MAG: UbiX family flavin prenyltransferase [Planctomycetaceae bacterium]|nr:UbiX family flavin prenyltransferase [Planctomycetaceae bacterium]